MTPLTASRPRIPLAGGQWLSPRAERVVVDLIAVLVGVAGELDDLSSIRPVPVLLTVAAGAALFGRRRYPVLVLVAMLATTGVLFQLDQYPGGTLACVALFTVAERCPTWASSAALVGTTVVLVALSVTSVPPPVAVWAVGVALRSRRQHHDDLRANASAAQREREQRAALEAHEERAEIARELHDIVAHSVTVMLVGVRGARDVITTEPDVAADVLSRVESSGEQSLVELRRLLALLRGHEGTAAPAPHRPLPGLAELPELTAGFGAAGLSVDLEMEDDPPAVEEGVGLSVYRIAEEALTNVLRHARSDRATVRLTTRPDGIDLEIVDRGVGPRDDGPASGHGLVGMRERARLLGGELSAGEGPEGGFRVAVRLPLQVST